jgi:hypothetical protein
MGTKWALGPFTIEQTTEDVTAIHRLAASRHPRANGFLATGSRLGNPSGDSRQGRRHGHGRAPDERSGRPRIRAPHGGGALGVNGRPEERSGGERTGPKRWVRTADHREGSPAPDCRGELGRRPEGALRAATREVKHGHELKIRPTRRNARTRAGAASGCHVAVSHGA